jgi:hypothetical protein
MATFGLGMRIKSSDAYDGTLAGGTDAVHTVSSGLVYAVVSFATDGDIALKFSAESVARIDTASGDTTRSAAYYAAAGTPISVTGTGDYHVSVIEFENGS